MRRLPPLILCLLCGVALGEPPQPATAPDADSLWVEGRATVPRRGRREQRLAEAQALAYENCLFKAAVQIDPNVARLENAARAALLERLNSHWHRIFVEAVVLDLQTGPGRVRLRVRCRFLRAPLAEALKPRQARRVVLITGPPAAAQHLERQLAQRLTAAGFRTLPVIALDPRIVPLWREAAGKKELGILFLYAEKAKAHRVVHGRLELTVTGQLVAGKPLFACKAAVSWRMIDATTGRIDEVSRLSATGEGLRRSAAETSAVDHLAAALAARLAKTFRRFNEPTETQETIYLRVSGLRFQQVRSLKAQMDDLSAVRSTWLMYFSRGTAMFAVRPAKGTTADELAAALVRLDDGRLKIQERKGSEWSCTVPGNAAAPSAP